MFPAAENLFLHTKKKHILVPWRNKSDQAAVEHQCGVLLSLVYISCQLWKIGSFREKDGDEGVTVGLLSLNTT